MAGLRAFLTHPRTIRISRIVLAVVFLIAALAKLGDLNAFAEQLHNFRMVPVFSENLLAMCLPWVELLAGLAMIFNLRARAASVLLTVLLAVFTVSVLLAMGRGLDFECGCFGTADSTRVGVAKVLQNTGLLLVGAVASLRCRS
jgi:putative oxidoreductase